MYAPRWYAIFLLGLWAILAVRSAWAQQGKAPEAGYVFPPVVQRGTTVNVQLGGFDLTPDVEWRVRDERIKLQTTGPLGDFLIPKPPYWFGEKGSSPAWPIPREVAATITVPAELPPGWVHWQVANANGSSPAAGLLISDRKEVVEQRRRDEPQRLSDFPLGVSGRIERIAEVDRYQLQLPEDGLITVECFARRLGSNFHAVLEVVDDQGRRVTDHADTGGFDGAVTFRADGKRNYEIRLHDVDFRGNRALVYRLAVTTGPRVVTTIPAAGRRGTTHDVTFIGYGIASGQPKLESTTRPITFPTANNTGKPDTGDPHTPGRSYLGYALQTPHGTAPAIAIPLSDLPEATDPEAMETPGAVTATMSKSRQADTRFDAVKGEVWSIEAQSRFIGTQLDLALEIHDTTGKVLATNDDAHGTSDAALQFKVPADGTYVCRVLDLSGETVDSTSVYRLQFKRQSLGFTLEVPQFLAAPIGGKASLTVNAIRLGGFQDEIKLQLRGLPAGVTVVGDAVIAAKKTTAKVALDVAATTSSQAAWVGVEGSAEIDGKQVTGIATATASGNLCPRRPLDHRFTRLLLTPTIKPPFAVKLVDKNRQRAVHRGTTYPAPFVIERQEGFTGPVALQMAARQGRHRQGIRGPIIQVPAGSDQALYPCSMPEWLETDRTTRMVVLGVAEVADAQGRRRHVTSVADARVTMILEGALLKVAHRAPELTVPIGQPFDLPIVVSRSSKLPADVQLELLVPEPIAGRLDGGSLKLAADQSTATLHINTNNDDALAGRWTLQVKATAMQDNRWPVVSQTDVEVEFIKP